MIGFIREVFAVPLRLLLFVCSRIEIFDKVVVANWLWRLTWNAEDAEVFLSFVLSKHGIEHARELADGLLLQTKDARVANVIAVYEFNSRNFAQTEHWINKATELECENLELLLWVRFLLALPRGIESAEPVIDEMVARNDLPSHYSEISWSIKSWLLVCRREWEKAEFYANRVLEIRDNEWALFTKWVLELRAGNSSVAEVLFEKAKSKEVQRQGKTAHVAVMAATGFALAGQEKRACEYLYDCREYVGAMRSDEILRGLLESDMFKEYCASREGAN